MKGARATLFFSRMALERKKKRTIKKVPVKLDKLPRENTNTNSDRTLQLAVDQFLDFLDAHKDNGDKA
jgi:hypothetical protein